jgi:hypothetical protein
MYPVFATNISYRWTTLFLVEHVLIVLAVGFAAALPSGLSDTAFSTSYVLWRAMLIAFVLQVCLHYCDLYDLRTLADRRDLLTGLLRALGAASLILAFIYFLIPSLIIGSGVCWRRF